MTTGDLLTTALTLAEHGCSVIPVRNDGTKAPAIAWKPYTTTPATVDQLHAWFGPDGPHAGLGIVTGAVSGNLELTELEGRAADRLRDLAELADASGLGDLWRLVATGWMERSPSGGIHLLYRVDSQVPGNTKLARRPATPDELAEHPGDRIKVLAETRGESGFVVAAPTPGSHHPTGQPWTRLVGGPHTIPTITLEQRQALHVLVSTLDETPAPEPPPTQQAAPRDPADGLPPGDDYEQRVSWAEILLPHGWTHVFTRGRTSYWRRPGKTVGISATTGHADDRDRLYVFTTSTDFDAERPYTKFGAYTVLEHGGDHSQAARQLRADGYGHRPEHPRPDDLRDLIAPAPASDGTSALAPQPAQPAPRLTVVPPTTYSETDDGNALRLVDAHGQHVRYCPQRGTWLHWDGHRWRWDAAGTIRELARAVARDLPADDKQEIRHRQASLSRRGIEAMVALAASDPRAVVHLDHLDARPYELNTPGGVIDLRTATLRPPDPAALHTRSTTVAPDFDAQPTRWLRFLADTFAGDAALTTYIQQLLGISLIGTVLEQILPFGFGAGANGKTTLVGAVQRVVGIGDDGYSISAPAEMLLAGTQQGHPTEIARLAGARLVVTSELEEGQRFAEARVKNLTGRDTISGRFMRQDWFSFTPTHTLWLLANHQPAVRAGGPAFWRRLRLLPFLHTVPPEQRIADLEDQLVEQEGPAVLAWIARGAATYLEHGLAEPDSVRAATDAYAVDQDTVGRFVTEMCQTGDPNSQVMKARTTALRAAYETWCRAEGESPISAKALTLELRSRYGVQSERSASARYYAGIRLLEDDDTDPSSKPEPTDDDRFWGRA